MRDNSPQHRNRVAEVCRCHRNAARSHPLLGAEEKTSMSHHYSGPDFGFPGGDPRLDLTDLYVFPKPGDAKKSILIMNVHPSSTLIHPELTSVEPFATNGLSEFQSDTNGDAIAEIAARRRLSPLPNRTPV